MMQEVDVERKELILVTTSVITTVATAIGLISDIPTVSANPTGQIVLAVIFITAVSYLGHYIIRRLIITRKKLERQLDEVKELLIDFTSTNANSQLIGSLDADEIRLIEKTKRAKSLPFRIIDVERVDDRRFRLVIDKGNTHGLEDTMEFRVFHNSRMQELGICPCTTFDHRAALVFTIDPQNLIPMNDVRKETVQVHLIDPTASNIVNLLIANLFHCIDHGA